jgi:hypothetical protein
VSSSKQWVWEEKGWQMTPEGDYLENGHPA